MSGHKSQVSATWISHSRVPPNDKLSASSLLSRKADFQKALLGWYRQSARPLPWRTAPSVYKTVVSEFMLQQTQVKTVLPYFARWMAELPDFAALAVASEARVRKLWEGLGYYARARNLHRLARVLAAQAELPRTADSWAELPGIGPYTAAAVASMGFGAAAACVDGNVVRVLARLTGDRTEFRDSATAAKTFTPLAERLLSTDSPGDHNQAMMELGATVCLRQNPLCPDTPRAAVLRRPPGVETPPPCPVFRPGRPCAGPSPAFGANLGARFYCTAQPAGARRLKPACMSCQPARTSRPRAGRGGPGAAARAKRTQRSRNIG